MSSFTGSDRVQADITDGTAAAKYWIGKLKREVQWSDKLGILIVEIKGKCTYTGLNIQFYTSKIQGEQELRIIWPLGRMRWEWNVTIHVKTPYYGGIRPGFQILFRCWTHFLGILGRRKADFELIILLNLKETQ